MSALTAQQRMLQAVQKEVLPRLRHRDLWQMAYIDAPFDFPPGVTVAYEPGRPLSLKESDPPSSSDITHNWLGLRLLASRFPCLGFVVEGSIDWRIGITERMARHGGRVMRQSRYCAVSLPRGTFFLMPPGVPYQEGDLNHWERSLRKGEPVKVMYVQFHRRGMTFHMNYTHGGRNYRDSPLFLPDARTIFAAEALIEELQLRAASSAAIAGSLLQFCMQRLERGLEQDIAQKHISALVPSLAGNSRADIVAQACVFLESHFDQGLNLEKVAAHVHMSSSHLTRLFRAETGMSINEYLTRYRLDCVRTLLEKTDLRINHIGKISGFGNHSYLCQVFQRHMGCSPQKYRYDSYTKAKAR